MGFRFRKSIKIAPGLRLNISKGGVSMSAGVRGASMSVGKRGVYGNVGLAGTGISYRQRLDNPPTRVKRTRDTDMLNDGPISMNIKLGDDGRVDLVDHLDNPLSAKHQRLFWAQEGETFRQWLEDRAREINGDMALFTAIHLDSPNPEEPPLKPEKPKTTCKPAFQEPVKPGFVANLLPSRRAKYTNALNQALETYDRELSLWEKEAEQIRTDFLEREKFWEITFKLWQQMQQGAIKHLKDVEAPIETMETLMERALGQLDWPRETLVSFSIMPNGDVWLDVDLPEIEDLPRKSAKRSTNGKRLLIREKTEKQLRGEYATHIHGIFFKLACTVLASLPTCQTAVISGYSQRLNKATGKVEDDYLYSVRATREGLKHVNFKNLAQVDPIETVTLFEHRRNMTTTGLFKPIRPFQPN